MRPSTRALGLTCLFWASLGQGATDVHQKCLEDDTSDCIQMGLNLEKSNPREALKMYRTACFHGREFACTLGAAIASDPEEWLRQGCRLGEPGLCSRWGIWLQRRGRELPSSLREFLRVSCERAQTPGACALSGIEMRKTSSSLKEFWQYRLWIGEDCRKNRVFCEEVELVPKPRRFRAFLEAMSWIWLSASLVGVILTRWVFKRTNWVALLSLFGAAITLERLAIYLGHWLSFPLLLLFLSFIGVAFLSWIDAFKKLRSRG